eukprot:602674-Amphidinium_carterae.1
MQFRYAIEVAPLVALWRSLAGSLSEQRLFLDAISKEACKHAPMHDMTSFKCLVTDSETIWLVIFYARLGMYFVKHVLPFAVSSTFCNQRVIYLSLHFPSQLGLLSRLVI